MERNTKLCKNFRQSITDIESCINEPYEGVCEFCSKWLPQINTTSEYKIKRDDKKC